MASPGAVFAVDAGGTAWAIDIADPTHPRVLSHADIPSQGYSDLLGTAWHAGYLYVLQYDFHSPDLNELRLAVVDASDTADITLLGAVHLAPPVGWPPGELRVDGDRLYVLGEDPAVFSLTNPE